MACGFVHQPLTEFLEVIPIAWAESSKITDGDKINSHRQKQSDEADQYAVHSSFEMSVLYPVKTWDYSCFIESLDQLAEGKAPRK
jgi:hypothetical protein